MALGIAATLLALFGIVRGFTRKNTPLIIVSTIGLMLVIAVWVYFSMNPY